LSAAELTFALIALLSNLEEVEDLLGKEIAGHLGIVVTLFLIMTVIYDRVFAKDPPERLADWAFYMGMYGTQIEKALSSERSSRKDAEIAVMIDYATQGLDDITSKWPDITQEVEYRSAHQDVTP
jgi:hypothetical protein